METMLLNVVVTVTVTTTITAATTNIYPGTENGPLQTRFVLICVEYQQKMTSEVDLLVAWFTKLKDDV